MKRNLVNRMLACALVSVMVFGAAACGSTDNEPGSDQGGILPVKIAERQTILAMVRMLPTVKRLPIPQPHPSLRLI